MAEQSLKNKTVKGVGWSAIDNVTQYGITFVVSIVLARLVTPEDYGLLGIVGIFTAVCTTLINGGFGSALIRKNDVSDNDYNTAFIVNFVTSLFLYIIIFISAPFIASFFNRQELVSLTRVSSLGMIIGALALVQQTRLTKKIDFKTLTKITLIASASSGLIGILMALLGFGVWALVAQTLSLQGLRTLLLWLFNRWVPKLRFSKQSFNDLFGFGWKIMVSGVLETVWKEFYQVVVGKFYSAATLGQYTRANGLSQLSTNNITIVIQRVTYPVLSNIQNDKNRMVGVYRRIIKITMFVTTVCTLFLGAVSEPLIYCLFGPQWKEAALYLPLICIAGTLHPLNAINLNMLQVQGRSDLFLVLEIVKKIVILVPLLVGALIGIMPMLYVNLFVAWVCYFFNSYFPGKLLGYSSWMQLKDIAPSYGVAILVSLSVFFLKYLPISNWIILPIQILIGLVVLFITCEMTELSEYEEIKKIVSDYLIKIRIKK